MLYRCSRRASQSCEVRRSHTKKRSRRWRNRFTVSNSYIAGSSCQSDMGLRTTRRTSTSTDTSRIMTGRQIKASPRMPRRDKIIKDAIIMASRTAMIERLAEAERAQERFAFAQEADADIDIIVWLREKRWNIMDRSFLSNVGLILSPQSGNVNRGTRGKMDKDMTLYTNKWQ